jgi:Fe-S cluster biogenesis protein NfuA
MHFTSEGRIDEVQAVLDSIRPAMEADGGGVELVSVDAGRVIVRLMGTCLACPSADLTMKLGIEQSLRSHLSWITAVERVQRRCESKD